MTEKRAQQRGAVQIQAAHRGRKARRGVEEKKKQQKGWRRELHKKTERQAAPPEEKSGAVRIQAAHRGRQARREVEEKKKHQRDGNPHPPGWRRDLHTKQVDEKRAQQRGAVQIQAAHRGRKARASSAHVEEKRAQTRGAVQIQAAHRGRKARASCVYVDAATAQQRGPLRPTAWVLPSFASFLHRVMLPLSRSSSMALGLVIIPSSSTSSPSSSSSAIEN